MQLLRQLKEDVDITNVEVSPVDIEDVFIDAYEKIKSPNEDK